MKVSVYGASWCAPCRAQKQWLDSKNVEYEYFDVSLDTRAFEYLNKLGISGVPFTAVTKNNKIEFIEGFSREKLAATIGV